MFELALGIVVVVALGRVAATMRRRAAKRQRMRAGVAHLADHALVTLDGVVSAIGEPLIGPLSGEPCVAFVARARIYRRKRKIESEHVEARMLPFVLATGDSDVLVDGELFDLVEDPAPIVPRNFAREAAFLAEVGLPPTHANDCGFDEARIELGAKIRVHGISRREIDPAPGEIDFRATPTRIRLTGDGAHPLIIDRV